MFAALPDARDGESLYSVLARFARYLGGPEATVYMTAIFGERLAIASHDLPGNLAHLMTSIAVERREGETKAVLRDLTGFPFHTAFSAPDVRQSVAEAMRGDVAGVHARLGVTAFTVRPTTHLRFCADCLDDMEKRHQDLWWRRDHQLPGVVVCAVHGCVLRLSTVEVGDVNRHAFHAASREVCRSDAPPAVHVCDERELALLGDLSRRAAKLLLDGRPSIGHADRVKNYRRRLEDVGLMRSRHKADQRRLRDAFEARWGLVPDIVPGLTLGNLEEFSWLASIVRDSRKAFHPLQHLMLEALLEDMTTVEVHRPFGVGPWECLNPLADHFGSMVISEVEVRHDRGTIYGDFTCGCGYKYTRSCDAVGTVGRPRYRKFGPLLVPFMREGLSEGMTLRAMARKAGLDPKTLVREAAIAGIDVPWSLKPSGAIPSVGTLAPSVRSGKSGRMRQRAKRRRNWFAIDARLSRAVERLRLETLAQSPPLRVTFVELERRVASAGWVAMRRAKLPMTSSAITAAQESLEDFRWRRLHWHAREMRRLPDLTASDVLRAAGLPGRWMPRVRSVLEVVLIEDVRKAS